MAADYGRNLYRDYEKAVNEMDTFRADIAKKIAYGK